MFILRPLTKFAMFLLSNIIYIALYGSVLLIAINNSMTGIVIFYITSHLTLVLLFISIITNNEILYVEEVSLRRLIFRLSIMGAIIGALIARGHWYLTGITLLFIVISARLYYNLKK